MEFDRRGWVEVMEPPIRELNEFFAKQDLRGDMHQGYIRIFQNGDDPDFRWNKGGRFYSQPFVESYQVMSAERRGQMTINGEPVAEIDIRASYLTIFLSIHGIQLETTEDPYALPGLGPEHRSAVKSWMVATFGSAKPIQRWPPRMLQKLPELRQHRVSTITKAASNKYPALETWGEPIRGRVYGWADLMYLESAVMFSMSVITLFDGVSSERFDASPTSGFPRTIELTGSGSRRPTRRRPSFDLVAEYGLVASPCKTWAFGPAAWGALPQTPGIFEAQ